MKRSISSLAARSRALPKNEGTVQGRTPPRREGGQSACLQGTRVRVEHSSAGVKVFRSARNIYRNFKAGFEDILIETACGLHNLRSDFPIEAWLKAA